MRICRLFVCCVVLAGCSRGTVGSLPIAGVAPNGGALTLDAALRPAPSFVNTSIYNFKGAPDGFFPWAGLVDVNGTFYGTSLAGGAGGCDIGGRQGCGSVFKVTPAGAESVVYSFQGGTADGWFPTAALIDVNGTLYGTTQYGGSGSSPECGSSGCGTVFAVTPTGAESLLYSFKGENGKDGAGPAASLIDVNGALYGTTELGGAGVCSGGHNCGTVFKVTTSGTESVLYNFKGGTMDGQTPEAGLIDVSGTLYGTTTLGGAKAQGTVFKVATSGAESVLHSFKGSPTDGAGPFAGLTDVSGTLYGTTEGGGAGLNNGTVFKIATSGAESVLYSFKAGVDGKSPYAGVVDVNGTLYGTTDYGGGGNGGLGFGIVFKVTPQTGSESVLHRFRGEPDGEYPYLAGLIDANGKLYGTTSVGGSGPNTGYGTIFKVPL